MTIKITKPGKEKIVREMVEVFKRHGVLDNISIIYNNQMVSFGSIDIDLEASDDELKYIYPEPEITLNKKPEDWNGNHIVVIYDGGALYSAMSGEFGWSWKDRIEHDLQIVFGPYHLAIEEIDNTSFTLAEGFEPEYETVIKKLSNI